MPEIKVPKVLPFGGHDWDIELDGVIGDKYNKAGILDTENLILKLSSKSLPSVLSATLLHELVHLIDWTFLGERLSESEVSSFSNGLYLLLTQLGVTFDFSELKEERDGSN